MDKRLNNAEEHDPKHEPVAVPIADNAGTLDALRRRGTFTCRIVSVDPHHCTFYFGGKDQQG